MDTLSIAKIQIQERIDQLTTELKALEITVAQYHAAIGELERLIVPIAPQPTEYIEAVDGYATT